MVRLAVILTVVFARVLFRSRLELMFENLALRQQLAVFKRKRSRPALRPADRVFWVVLRQVWHGWVNALILVQPDTVVDWQRQGFKLFWRWVSRAKKVGRPWIAGYTPQPQAAWMAQEGRNFSMVVQDWNLPCRYLAQ